MNMLSDAGGRELGLHLWQSTAFALLIAVLMACLPGPAWLRHFAGLLGLLRFLLPAGLFAALVGNVSWAPLRGVFAHSALEQFLLPPFVVRADTTAGSTTVLGLPLGTFLVAAWATGTLLLAGFWLVRLLRGLHALRTQARPFSPAKAAQLRALALRAGVKPDTVSGHTVNSSGWLGVVGLFRSRIIIPEGLFSRMDKAEEEAVLLHELAHVRRHDNLLRLLQAGVVALFWFHPLVWWLHRRLVWDSERACDEAVLELTGANHAYATGLCKAVHHALEITLPGVSGMSRLGLQARVHAVLNHKNRTASPMKNSLLITALLGLLGLTTLFANPSPTPAADAAKAAPENSVLDASQVSQLPVVVTQVPPRYPAELKKKNIQGNVTASFVVDVDGSVIDVQVLKSSDPRFEAPAIEALRQWKFKCGSKEGVPVKVRLAVPVVFKLGNK